jgi:hypothetical protein
MTMRVIVKPKDDKVMVMLFDSNGVPQYTELMSTKGVRELAAALIGSADHVDLQNSTPSN